MFGKKIGSKRPAPESFIDALLPALKTPSSPDETMGKVPKQRRIFLSQAKLQHAALLQSQSGHRLGVMECLLASSKATRAAADEQLAFNNAKISFNSVEEGTLNFSAFKTNRMGKQRSSEAERQAISRAWQRISDAIFSVGNYSQESLALHHALLHPDTRSVAKTAGFKAMRFQRQLVKEMLAVAMFTAKEKGRVNADEAAFVETILTAVAPDMTSEEAAPSARESSDYLGYQFVRLEGGSRLAR
jgi:hypothetical protein